MSGSDQFYPGEKYLRLEKEGRTWGLIFNLTFQFFWECRGFLGKNKNKMDRSVLDSNGTYSINQIEVQASPAIGNTASRQVNTLLDRSYFQDLDAAIEHLAAVGKYFCSFDHSHKVVDEQFKRRDKEGKNYTKIELSDIEGVDLREFYRGWRVGNQYKTNSCVGWAIGTGALDYYLNKEIAGVLKEKTDGMFTPLGTNHRMDSKLGFKKRRGFSNYKKTSPRFIWTMSKEYDAEVKLSGVMDDRCGTRVPVALSAIMKYKISAQEKHMPFLLHSPFQFIDKNFLWDVASLNDRLLALGIYMIMERDESSNMSLDESRWASIHALIRDWLCLIGPLIVEFDMEQSFKDLSEKQWFQKLEPLSIDNKPKNSGWHACSIVGFRKLNGKNIYRLKNSYGIRWGAKGTFEVTEEYLMKTAKSICAISNIHP